MNALPFSPASFDLIWSEGALYQMGFENGLKTCLPLLASGGYLAVSEAVWLRPDPPDECRKMWDEEYPAISDIEANLATIESCGYENVGNFTLPESAWLEGYYAPLEKRLIPCVEKYKDDPDAQIVFDSIRTEIEAYRKFSKYYGYQFFVARKK